MVTDAIGLYVHIPFCKSKCRYCDFCSSVASLEEYERYTERLISEIRAYKREPRIAVGTVFFGGGTPSVLPLELIRPIFDAIRETFTIFPGAEITVEANPGTLTEEQILAYRELGVNRMSIGMQSVHENELKILGRIHTFEDARRAVDMIRGAGFINFNIDLMYGIPEQTLSSFEKTLDEVIAMEPSHVSCYGLILEEGTPLYRMKDSLDLPSEEEEYGMYELAISRLGEAGYSHYEISNYERDGFYSFHNLRYWHDEEYIGVGLSAHSYFGGKRYYSPERMSEYLSGDGVQYLIEDECPDRPFEYVMMRMRLSEGISLSEYEALFGEPFTKGREEKLSQYEEAGFVRRDGDRLAFTDKGMYVSNTLLSRLL